MRTFLPLVSVVTISYNQAEFLEKTIRSVIAQDYPYLEHIVVDPGSTDGSLAIIERYRHWFAEVIVAPDDGPADGLNKGFLRARGAIFAFLNADDVLLPGAVTRAIKVLSTKGGMAAVIGSGILIDEGGQPRGSLASTTLTMSRLAHGCATFVQPSSFFTRAAFETAGGFNPRNHTCWDLELFVDMLQLGTTFTILNWPLAAFRRHPGQISGSGRLQERYEEDKSRLFHHGAIRHHRSRVPVSQIACRVLNQLEIRCRRSLATVIFRVFLRRSLLA